MTMSWGTCCGNPEQVPSPGGFLEEVLNQVSQEEEEVFSRGLLVWKDPHTGMVSARRGYRKGVLLSMAFRPGALWFQLPLLSLSCPF